MATGDAPIVLRAVLPIGATGGLVTRGAPAQTLVACGNSLRQLLGTQSRGALRAGRTLRLTAPQHVQPAAPHEAALAGLLAGGGDATAPVLCSPVWDAQTGCMFLRLGCAVVRVAPDDSVSHVAGEVHSPGVADGRGPSSRRSQQPLLVGDGAGTLWAADKDRLRCVRLPEPDARNAAAAGKPAHARHPSGAAPSAAAATKPSISAGAAQADVDELRYEDEAHVSTILADAPGSIRGLAYVPPPSAASDGPPTSSRGGSLVFATSTCLYRLPLHAAPPSARPVPQLLAGREGERGGADGRGAEARFGRVTGLAADAEGCLLVTDRSCPTATSLRRVSPGGVVSTLVSALEGVWSWPAILPNGYLALCSDALLHVLDLGLKPPRGPGSAAGAHACVPRSLRVDLSALLRRQPDGSADVTVLVGERPFAAHKAILGARSDYFHQRFGGGFADGNQQRLALPDADPDVFAVVLLYIYTDDVDVPPALAQGVAELADRLLLPELCAAAQAAVEAGVTPSSVVGSLLWADAAGPVFADLLGRLKAYYVAHHERVMEEAPASLRLLAAQAPDMIVDLMMECKRAAAAGGQAQAAGQGAGTGR